MRSILDDLEAPLPSSGSGAAAASTVALAAAVVVKLARAAGNEDLATEARSLRQRAEGLATWSATAFTDALAALDRREDEFRLSRTLASAADAPLAIARAAQEVADLAAAAERGASEDLRADAVAAARLAAGAAAAASYLVEVNLIVTPEDERLAAARGAAEAAATTADSMRD